jgi:Flp pilus assembly protein TadD
MSHPAVFMPIKPLMRLLFVFCCVLNVTSVFGWDFSLPRIGKPAYYVRQPGYRTQLKKDLLENPLDPDLFARMAEAQLDVGNLQKAGRYLESGWKKGRESAYLSLVSGKFQFAHGHIPQAGQQLFRALVLSKQEEPRYFHEYCAFLFATEKYEKALHWTQMGLHLHPMDFVLRYLLALIYARIGHLNNAELAFYEAMQIEPQSPFVHYNLAYFHAVKSNQDGTIYHLRRAAFCGYRNIKQINNEPAFNFIREHPQALLIFEQIGRNQLRHKVATSFNKI